MFTLLLALFLVSTSFQWKYLVLKLLNAHSAHQLVANCVFLLFEAEQVVYSWLIRGFSLKTAAWSR